MKKIRIAILSVTVVSLLAGYGIRTLVGRKIDERAALVETVPGALFADKGGSPPHYRAGDGTIAFNSYDVVPSIRGYAGPIKVILALDPEGRIAGIKILEHRETKNYVHYLEMPAYLSRFIGKRVTDPFEVDKDIDAVTRATVSVEALARTVKESSRTVAADVLGMDVGTDRNEPRAALKWVWLAVLFPLSLAAYFATRRSRKLPLLRDLSLVAGSIIIGFYLSVPFSILHVLNVLLLRPSSSMLWLAIVTCTVLSVVIAGRFYCGWLCPFGALCEFIGRIPVRKWEIPRGTDDAWRRLKYILLGLVIALVLVSGRTDYGSYEAYVTLFSYHGSVLAWSLAAIALVANIRVERFWCRYLCPVAALTGLLSRRAKGYPGGNDCPMENRQTPEISECIRCNRCYQCHRS